MRTILKTRQFVKDEKRMFRRGYDLRKLKKIVNELASGNILEKKYCNHTLQGNLHAYQECHIEPNWLLVYRMKKDALILELMRTGTHSDLF